jgi:Ser/Thr protein kinase RdoA (MazF antagonist)
MIIDQLSKQYGYKFDDIQLLRDWIGQVYIVNSGSRRYILKIFKKQHSDAAKQSVSVMNYLKENDFPVPAIMKTLSGESCFLTVEDSRVAVLYEYIEGTEPDRDQNLKVIGELLGYMQKIMEHYPGELFDKDEKYYIERYISILSDKNYEGTDQFHEHGIRLWNRVKDNASGFCHGDFHAGNMIMNNNKIILFDFDACGIAHPIYDIATLCDETDYFNLSDRNFENGIIKTKENVEEFLRGYNIHYNLNENEIRAFYDYIALRHYDIQATIIDCRGLNCVDNDFLDNQYKWLIKWETVCDKI